MAVATIVEFPAMDPHPPQPRPPTAASEGIEGWLSEARAGSREALGRALDACRGQLLWLASRLVRPELRRKSGASDLVQESLLEAQRDFARFHGASEPELRAWLQRILLNNLKNLSRRFRGSLKRDVGREVSLEGDGEAGRSGGLLAAPRPSPSSEARRGEEAEALERAIDSLPPHYREVIISRYREGRSFEDIAGATGRSLAATRKLWYRGLELLAEELASPSWRPMT
jgi:RNA polymerase sigma-70 factor, ECF subfamily